MRILIRHFFERFFDKESLSPQGEPEASFTQTLGFLAVPGAFIVLLFQPLSFRAWDLVMIRCFFVSFSMIIMGFIVVFEWDALFPDRRDYQILTPLPVGLWSLFLAKAMAMGLFLGVFLVDINFFSALMWPGIDGGKDLLGAMGAHLATVILSGLFAALAMAAIQGVLVALLPATAFRRVSVWMQTFLNGCCGDAVVCFAHAGKQPRRTSETSQPVGVWVPWILVRGSLRGHTAGCGKYDPPLQRSGRPRRGRASASPWEHRHIGAWRRDRRFRADLPPGISSACP